MIRRRSFLGTPLAALPLVAGSQQPLVSAFGDGLSLTPLGYSQLLASLAGGVTPDDYSLGGVVAQLEQRMAAELGKETAVWMPTGTLANHLAVRLHAAAGRRVLVQAESHLYNDSGDCAQTLSGLNLIPLAPGRATFTLQEAEQAANNAMLGRVMTPVGAIQIETPVRRLLGARFDFDQMKRVTTMARARGIGLHLDGARLYIESVYTGRPVQEYAALFDTVYVSLYKYFNAASGAVLAGPKALLSGLFQTRRMFGGGLHQAWPFAAVALHYVDGFPQRFRAGMVASEQVIAALSQDSNFEVERIPDGTNVFRMRVRGVNAPIYHGRLEEAGISARAPQGEWFTLFVNETWARVPASEIAGRFRKALG
jgi:threonine aldolase